METISNIWVDGGIGHYTKREPMYIEYLNKQLPNFKGGRVLEIGPGTGVFAKMLIENFDITDYHVLDLEKNVQDSVSYIKSLNLGIELEYTYSQNYEDLFDKEFDLIVSNICIPETPKDYREDLLNNIIPNSKSSMIIGQLRGKWVEGDEYETWIKNLFNENYDNVECELTPYLNCYALTGEKK